MKNERGKKEERKKERAKQRLCMNDIERETERIKVF